MSDDAPLTSATLAQLYLAQGHPERASAVIDELLRKNPLDGHALALRERMSTRALADLACEVHRKGIHVRFLVHPEAGDGPFHVLLATAGLVGIERAIRVTSRPCSAAEGEMELPRPAGPGSGELALACLQQGRLTILARRELASWS